MHKSHTREDAHSMMQFMVQLITTKGKEIDMFKFIEKNQENPYKVIESIKHLENKYNITFPDILKDLYSKSESGKILLSTFFVGHVECDVDYLISVVSEGFCFESIVDADREDDFIPNTLYPVAMNQGGDIYYWDSNEKKVYLSFSDDIENPFLISNSVEEFISLLNNNIVF